MGGYSGLASLTAISPLQFTATVEQVNCYGDSTGSITITITGGLPPMVYSWANGEVTQNLTNPPAGNYALTITDAASQTVTGSYTITQPAAALQISLVKTDVSVQNAGDGSIDLMVSGGTQPYSYLWTNSQTTQDISGLSAGIFSVTVTDYNSCSILANIEVFDTIQSQTLTINNGWNLISTYMTPIYPQVDSVFRPVVSHLVIMKSTIGQVFWPQYNIKGISNNLTKL